MIISKLQGGLGNQLFQWAAGKSASLQHKCEYRVDTSFYSTQNLRKYELDKFNISDVKFIDNKILSQFGYIIHPDSYSFDNIPYQNGNITYMDGYWQSEKYFKENESHIRKDLVIPNNIENYILSKYPFISENCISMHVRRTDYVSSNGYHTVQPIDYYKNGYDLINNKLKVVIFSDDIEWCKKNMKFDNDVYIENEDNIIDLYLMSMCKYNIIANSSFSWWGAWLNSQDDKKVICPSTWFGVDINISDMIPDSWIKI